MDQHGEKEENNSEESASAADQREETAVAEGEDTSEGSMDQLKEDGYKADESTDLVEDDVVGSEEASAPPPFAHPWSLLRVCAGCLGLLGCCGDQQKPPPAAVVAAATEAAMAAAAARSTQEEEEAGGEKPKANPPPPPHRFYIQEVITRVWAVAVSTPPPADHAREGSGGHGGAHH